MRLTPPEKVRKLQAALHAKAKGSPGYTIGRRYSPKTGRAVYTTWPSKGRTQRLCARIREMTSRRCLRMDVQEMVARLNRRLRGWANYFCLGSVSKAYRAVDAHARQRLRRWLCLKHKKRGRGTSHYPDATLYEALGLVRLPVLTQSFPWAKGVSPCPKAGCGKTARPV